jgi:hypothetical protein
MAVEMSAGQPLGQVRDFLRIRCLTPLDLFGSCHIRLALRSRMRNF